MSSSALSIVFNVAFFGSGMRAMDKVSSRSPSAVPYPTRLFKGRYARCWRRCTSRTLWNVRMASGLDAVPTMRFVR